MNAEALNALNPYLHGAHAPIRRETQSADLTVTGEIPRDFGGAYYRNGPDPLADPSGLHHWFDGDGMIHALHIEDGRARYRNRYVRTDDFEAERRGELDRPGIFSPAAPAGRTVYKDTANTDVVMHAGALMALWYVSGRPVRMDADTLETLGGEDFGGALPKNVSAHSKVDPETGEFLFFDYDLYEPFYSYGVVDAANRLTHFTRIALPGPRLPHDMAITENHAVLMDLPVVFTEQGLKNRIWSIHQDARLPTRFGVIPKYGQGTDIRWFEFPGCYIYHVVNAWEEGDEIHLYACKMVDNGRDLPTRYGPYAPMVGVLALRAHLTKWTMNLKTGATKEEQVDDTVGEFPIVNLGHTGRHSRYSYHVSIPDTDVQVFDGLLKYDLARGTHTRHDFGPGVYGSEPAFAPRLDARSEDDGYLVTFVTDAARGQSRALIIDAQDMAAPPLAQIHLPQRVPLGFHGTWANASEFAAA
ncbi:MAG: carotenoid oxygenase family protein [Pseudomonadota bacterium]